MLQKMGYLVAAAAIGLQPLCAFSQTAPPEKKQPEAKSAEKPATLFQEKPSETHHSIRVKGQAIKYLARAGYLEMYDEEGKHKANIFYIAYEKEPDQGESKRPITFAFNGGPGSSSVWLHMGALGPRRVKMGDAGEAMPPPYEITDNENTWLTFTDLVFIDPVMTGYSRPATGEDKRQFHGVDEDVQSVGEFIRLYLTKYERWLSPKYLTGESYGTTRAAALSGYLLNRYGIYLNGICLISSVLQFQTLEFDLGNDLPFALFLPTYTATAWYHKKLPADLQADLAATLKEVETWALGEYLVALAKGDALAAPGRRAIAEKLARYTGLSPEYIEATDLRIYDSRFVKELLRGKNRTVGRLDSRFQGVDRLAVGERSEYDPSYAAIYGAFTAAVNDYLRRELKYENDLIYEILTGRVRPWKWMDDGQGYVNVAESMRRALNQNPYLKVFVANGYYDLATPYFATAYTFNHLQLDPDLRKNVQMGFYQAGHMMYIHKPSLEKLTAEVAAFVREAAAQAPQSRPATAPMP